MTDEMLLRTAKEQAEKDYATWLDSLAIEEADRAFEERMEREFGGDKVYEHANDDEF